MDDNFNILIWNGRGLNARARRDSLRIVVGESNATIISVQETKLHAISPYLVSEMLGARLKERDGTMEQYVALHTTTTSQALQLLAEDAIAWTSAGAQHLAVVRWPGTQGLTAVLT